MINWSTKKWSINNQQKPSRKGNLSQDSALVILWFCKWSCSEFHTIMRQRDSPIVQVFSVYLITPTSYWKILNRGLGRKVQHHFQKQKNLRPLLLETNTFLFVSTNFQHPDRFRFFFEPLVIGHLGIIFSFCPAQSFGFLLFLSKKFPRFLFPLVFCHFHLFQFQPLANVLLVWVLQSMTHPSPSPSADLGWEAEVLSSGCI